jgi:hypothetical protein
MKPWQYFITIALGVLCVGLSVAAVFSGKQNQKLQGELQLQQATINKGSLSQQVGTNLLRDIAQVGTTNERVKELLTQNGYTLTANPSPSPAPSATP